MNRPTPTLWVLALILGGCGPGIGYDGLYEADSDRDGYPFSADCNDNNPNVHSGAVETCNGQDDDCNGLTDDGVADAPEWYGDIDGDGVGDAADTVTSCAQPAGYASQPGDCDDQAAGVGPGTPEQCDGVDQDCDGEIDEDAANAPEWYADTDGDGVGDASTSVRSCTLPVGFVAEAGDCDDTDPARRPGAAEICNEVDDDCDGAVDEDLVFTDWWLDADGDGWGTGAPTSRCDGPQTSEVPRAGDCDDGAAEIFPGATEVCDGVDQNCNGQADEGIVPTGVEFYADTDGDGYGALASAVRACSPPPGFAGDGTDCDDTSSSVHPGADEHCDGVDEDCNALVDDNVVGGTPFYADLDGDNHGGPDDVLFACTQPSDRFAVVTDCDDADVAVSPDGSEVCNGQDDDCDGLVDEAGALGAPTWYADVDDDGHGGVSAVTLDACEQPAGFTSSNTDCDDHDATVHPGADETCDDRDQDCDGEVDEEPVGTNTWYPDDDRDGFGDVARAAESCDAPAGWVSDATDCDDGEPSTFPGQVESCNEVDDDCDGTVDEDAAGVFTWHADADDDGWGVSAPTIEACTKPDGFAAAVGDCDDTDPAIHPETEPYAEIPGDGIDQDCDGQDDCRDLNCDGMPDLVVFGVGTQTHIYWAQRRGPRFSIDHSTTIDLGAGTEVMGMAWGQLDADGIPDLLLQHETVGMDLHRGSAIDTPEATSLGSAGGRVTSGDFDGDGTMDVVVSGNPVAVSYGPWTDGNPARTTSLAASNDRTPVVEDLDGDGHAELIVSVGNNHVRVHTGSLAGWSDGAATLLSGLGNTHATRAFAPIDLDNDGDLDLVVGYTHCCATGPSLVYWNDDGFDSGNTTTMQPGNTGHHEVRDIDGDGYQDLLAGRASSIDVWMGSPGGIDPTAAPDATLSTPNLSAFALDDFDQDGDLDLVALNRSFNGSSYWEWDSTFVQQPWAPASYSYGASTADTNLDGYPDLIAADVVHYGGPSGLGSGASDVLGFASQAPLPARHAMVIGD